MELTKQEGTSFVIEAKPFRPKPGAPEEKEYLPADFTETPPQWSARQIDIDGTLYDVTLEPVAGTTKCKITLPSFPDNETTSRPTVVTCTIDAKRGEGVVELTRSFVINVAPEEPTDVDFVEVDG